MNMNMIEDLEGLIERACKLQEGLNEEIKNTSVSFCHCCSLQNAETHTPLEEKQRLIASRDSVKELHDILIHIQRMKAWHVISKEGGVKQVEESRMIVMERVSEYEGRPLSVIEELNSSFGFGHGRSASDGRLKMKYEKRRSKNRFVGWCMEFMCNRGRWQAVIGGAAKVIAASIGVSCIVQFSGRGKQICSSSMRRLPNSHNIDVFKGRG